MAPRLVEVPLCEVRPQHRREVELLRAQRRRRGAPPVIQARRNSKNRARVAGRADARGRAPCRLTPTGGSCSGAAPRRCGRGDRAPRPARGEGVGGWSVGRAGATETPRSAGWRVAGGPEGGRAEGGSAPPATLWWWTAPPRADPPTRPPPRRAPAAGRAAAAAGPRCPRARPPRLRRRRRSPPPPPRCGPWRGRPPPAAPRPARRAAGRRPRGPTCRGVGPHAAHSRSALRKQPSENEPRRAQGRDLRHRRRAPAPPAVAERHRERQRRPVRRGRLGLPHRVSQRLLPRARA